MKTEYFCLKKQGFIKDLFIKPLGILLFIFLINCNLAAQEKTFLTFAVMILHEVDMSLPDATAKLYEKGNLLSTVTSNKDGIALFNLKANTEYTIEFSKQNYVSKIISINTKVPEYEKQVFEQTIELLLFKPCKGLDYSLLNEPVVKLAYNDVRRDFLPEKNYDNVMRDKLAQLLNNNDKCIEEEYNAIVRKADKLFNEKKYLDSRSTYQEALERRSKDKYVINRIKEIDELLAKQKDSDKTYNDYIAQADKQFNAKNYPLAKEFYKRAQSVKPSEKYPPSQIAAIDALLAQKEKEETDKKTAEAQRIQQEQARQAQLEKEQQANQAKLEQQEKERKELAAKAEQDRKAQQAKEEQDRKALQAKEEQDRKEREARYTALIKQGDNAFNSDVCGKSLQSYREALIEKPNDPAALKKISEAENKCKEEQARAAKDKSIFEAYNNAIKEADKLFAAKSYIEAKNYYQKASKLLTAEEYPITKVDEINSILKALEKEEQQQYKKLLSEANKAFDNENFPSAKDLFNQVLKLRPNDIYSKEKLQTIEGIEAENKRLEAEKKAKQDQYNKIIAEADAAFKKPDFVTAKASYQKALALLPSESYPKQKLGEIDKLEKEQLEKLEKEYNAKVQSADRNFAAKNYTLALQDYKDASKMKPAESYPKERIDDVNKILAEQARAAAEQKAKQEAYDAAIKKADVFFKNAQYNEAIVAYKEASSFKPTEQYPFTKIDEISEIKRKQQVEESYKKAIASANSFFDQKKYEQSKSYYNQALEAKPGDKYATEQIARADAAIAEQIRKLADQKARQDAYDQAMTDGNKYFTAQDYEMARTSFQTALSIFADKPVPKQKIAEIDKILKDKKSNEEYAAIFSEANVLFSAANYEQAKAKYKSASLIKPEEPAPIERIKEIDRILVQREADKQKMEQLEKNYNETVKRANDLFDKGQYDASKKEYEAALTLMPNESYPKQKIAKIAEITKLLSKESKPATQAKDDKPAATGKMIADLAFKNESEREIYLRELLTKYPAGITVEVYKESNRVVTRYVIVREDAANEFREIKYNWGGVDYSRNGKPITYLYFSNQTRTKEGEYFLKKDM